LTGCGTPIQREAEESIIRVCKNEYKVDVKVRTVGKTIAIYLPLTDLLDFTFNLTKSAGEKIQGVMLVASG